MATVTLKNIATGPIEGGLDLTIHDREFVVLAADGTSTILRLIAGLEDLHGGEILFDDRRVDTVAPKERDVAWLARNYTPYPGLSVFENLAIGLRGRNFAETEIKKRISAVAAALGLETQLEANANSLQLEQQRLVGLARAMVRQPKVYLFDEPFAGLDSEAARRGRAEVTRLYQRSSPTIIYATRLAEEALAFGERTVVLTDGVIQQDSSVQEIYDVPANLTVAKFFGDPPMNLVAGTLKQERNGLVFSEAGDGTIAVLLSSDRFPNARDFLSRPVVLGFRPEDVRIEGSGGSAKDDGFGFRALVDRAERRGSAADLFLQTGAHALIARSLRPAEAQVGQRLQFRITVEKAHLFDAESGQRVRSEA
ncbi:MAG TPA: ABC transporter ATP-binding protein [Chthoniobacterales bacterium]|nr:ABC transporter ATP-binding protein [Chthoniobacterales bacterium]